MIVAERMRERMAAVGLTQAELARRVGVKQPTVFKLLHGESRGSSYLHLIARELQTTVDYLTAAIDDPTAGAAPVPRQMPFQLFPMKVALPGEAALKDMFLALLKHVPDGSSKDEAAAILARRLPNGLAGIGPVLLDPVMAPTSGGGEEPPVAAADRAPPSPALRR